MTPALRPRRSTRVAGRLRVLSQRGKRAAVTAALVGATLIAGPLPAAEATTTAPATSLLDGDRVSAKQEDELAAGLAAEYIGAVPAADVTGLVHRVSRQLRADGSPPRLLLRTTEAVSRRALTDHLARGVPLPW